MTQLAASDPDAVVTRLRLQVAAGVPPRDLATLPADLRPAIALADGLGAPLLPAVDAAVEARRQRAAVARQVDTATAPARTVAAALILLPAVAVPIVAGLLDLDLVAFYTAGVGRLVGLAAVGLWAIGAAVIVAMVARAGRDPVPPGPTARVLVASIVAWVVVGPWLALVAGVVARVTFRTPAAPPHPALADAGDMVATGLSAGMSAAAALREAARHLPAMSSDLYHLAWQVDLGRATAGPPSALVPLAATIADGLDTGGPLVPALRALAADLRARGGAAAEQQALRLPTRLTFPTALCLLPATIALIGAPIVVTGLTAVAGP